MVGCASFCTIAKSGVSLGKHDQRSEVWIKLHKLGSGLPSITSKQAIDVALCWGWIDAVRKGFDATSYLQRYTPRRITSIWSHVNVANVARLIAVGRMTPHGLREAEAAKADGRWDRAYASGKAMRIPDDLQAAIDAVPSAKRMLASLSEQNRFALAFRVHNMKTDAGRKKKIETFVAMLTRGGNGVSAEEAEHVERGPRRTGGVSCQGKCAQPRFNRTEYTMLVAIEPGVRLYIDIDGCGLVPDGPRMREKPTLVVLHGGPGFDHTSFKPLFGRFTDIAQVLYLDHRGHGRSTPWPADAITLDLIADDVVRLCDALGIVKPVVLGQSFGGFVAQRYLARHPAHPARVVLSSTSHHFGLERKLARFEQLGGAAARSVAEAFWRKPCAETWAPYDTLCKPLYNTRPAPDPLAGDRTTMHTDILFSWSAREMPGLDLRPGLAQVTCPVLVLAGDEDPVTPVEDAAEIAAAIPAPWGSFVRIAGAGHGTWRDRPDESLAVLRQFIGAATR